MHVSRTVIMNLKGQMANPRLIEQEAKKRLWNFNELSLSHFQRNTYK